MKELIEDVFNYGYYSYHECNDELDYQQNLKECLDEFKDYAKDNWIKIESEEDLPKESNKSYFVVTKNKNIKFAWFNTKTSKFYTFNDNREFNSLTHYKLIEKPNLP